MSFVAKSHLHLLYLCDFGYMEDSFKICSKRIWFLCLSGLVHDDMSFVVELVNEIISQYYTDINIFLLISQVSSC